MKYRKIKNQDGNGHYQVFATGNFEFKNPQDVFVPVFYNTGYQMTKELLLLDEKTKNFPLEAIEFAAHKKGLELAEKRVSAIIEKQKDIPTSLIELLKCSRKKDQIKTLKGLSVDPLQLMAFYFKACSDFGYCLSHYEAEILPKDVKREDLPTLIQVTDSGVESAGETTMSEGKMRQTISQRKKIVAKFIDGENGWHCFFFTYKSLRGEESWRNGQPHLHYLSDKFGLPREEVVKGIKAGKYPKTSSHISLHGYGNQPD